MDKIYWSGTLIVKVRKNLTMEEKKEVAEEIRKVATQLEEDLEKCEICGGTGEISTDERDSSGNWERGVGTAKCPDCSKKDE